MENKQNEEVILVFLTSAFNAFSNALEKTTPTYVYLFTTSTETPLNLKSLDAFASFSLRLQRVDRQPVSRGVEAFQVQKLPIQVNPVSIVTFC